LRWWWFRDKSGKQRKCEKQATSRERRTVSQLLTWQPFPATPPLPNPQHRLLQLTSLCVQAALSVLHTLKRRVSLWSSIDSYSGLLPALALSFFCSQRTHRFRTHMIYITLFLSLLVVSPGGKEGGVESHLLMVTTRLLPASWSSLLLQRDSDLNLSSSLSPLGRPAPLSGNLFILLSILSSLSSGLSFSLLVDLHQREERNPPLQTYILFYSHGSKSST